MEAYGWSASVWLKLAASPAGWARIFDFGGGINGMRNMSAPASCFTYEGSGSADDGSAARARARSPAAAAEGCGCCVECATVLRRLRAAACVLACAVGVVHPAAVWMV